MARLPRPLVAGLAVWLVAIPGAAQTEGFDDRVSAARITFEPVGDARIGIADRVYAGTMTVAAHSGGLALVEETSIDDYLLGIREVPFSWPHEALAAQVVAARTYLAWTLDRGRSPNGRTFDYDICATTACQVYSGVGGLGGDEGRRWVDAVQRTSGEVLMADGVPVQALYSSTSDGRTRNVEDVFPGASPDPNLRAAPSPGETSPFVQWEFVLSRDEAEAMFAHAGLVDGVFIDVVSRRTADGGGPWTVTVRATGGERTIDTWTLRTRLNRAAADLFPDAFPAFRPGSTRRYPQTIMSPNFSIRSELVYIPPVSGPPGFEQRFRIRGGGWGHLVGMSQFGAEAMATAGSTYPEILSHFYGGVVPTVADVIPARIRVGLGTEMRELEVVAGGPLRVTVDGEEVSAGELGTWLVSWDGGVAIVDPPEGLGLAPQVSGWRTFFDSRGVVYLVTVRSRTAAETRIVVTRGGEVISDTDWIVREAGVIAIDLDPVRARSAVTVEVFVRSPLGEDSTALRILGGSE
ncbi:MAG TPA: SpoIID/LytB domain-containing protein [Acidimicrobiia bacterium]|nr:SpoIID/LytB domain-containing protein [Acidimicrobiia bacterium]